MNATITVKPTRRLKASESHLPRHILHDAPEIVAAQKVNELIKAAFAAHGIHAAIHAPNLGELADAIAHGMGTADTRVPMPGKPAPLTAEEIAEIRDLIDN